jgi:hypothetical protein
MNRTQRKRYGQFLRGVGYANHKASRALRPPPPHHWFDHVKIDKEGNFISEPYGLNTDDIKELGKIAAKGFEVHIDAKSERYPGRTVKVIRMDKILTIIRLRTNYMCNLCIYSYA